MTNTECVSLAPAYAISRIINGCWQLTSDHGGGPGSTSDTLRTFAELVDHGFTTFDCADIYAGTESLLGRFRRTLSDPESIQIHTKFVPNKETLHLLDDHAIDAGIDRSLKRLGIEQLDLVQFHWWNYDVPGLDRLTQRLLTAQQAGKIRLLGLTNFNTEYVRHIAATGASIISLQTQYSLLDRRPEKMMAAASDETGIRLIPYGVLAGGFISQAYVDQPCPASLNRSLQKYRLVIDEAGGWSALQRLLRLLSRVAEKHSTTLAAIAARWVLDQSMVGAIILGVGRQSRAAENAAIIKLQLDDEDYQCIHAHLNEQTIPPGDMFDLERDETGRHAQIIRTDLQTVDEDAPA